ncbi:site-specific integrase [Streptomyces jumonjinensis]|uniref:Site-specific integrase n=1 Tax=Streptomyces jumonjinensis TaxID=1945 RepID=A0A646KLM4_STRJU|nr:site-specific integrase [Streptomyces jumonjinensis]
MEEYPPEEYGERKKHRDCIGAWQARYRDPAGKQRSKNFKIKDGGKTAAEAFLDKTRTDVRERRYRDPKRSQIRLAAWWQEFWDVEKKKGKLTTRNRKMGIWTKYINPKWGGYRLIDLEYMALQRWLTHEVPGYDSQKKAKELLIAVLAAAIKDGERISVNPAVNLEVTATRKKKHPDDLKPPTEAQYALIHAALPPYYQVILKDFAHETGLRPGEYAGLRLHCIDDDERLAHIKEILVLDGGRLVRQLAPKTDAGFRTVPLTDRAWTAVEFMKARWAPARTRSAIGDGYDLHVEELLIRGPRGAALNVNNLSRPWHRATVQAGVARKVYNPETKRHEWWPRVYDYRHTVTTRLHGAGVPEKDAQSVLGQERGGRVTWVYTHESEDARERVRDALGGGRGLRVVS